MQGRALLTVLVVLAALLAGCAGAKDAPPAPGEADSGDGGRVARGGGPAADPDEAKDVELTEVSLFSTAFQSVASADQSFDLEIPANITQVLFRFTSNSVATQSSGLQVELLGCGRYDQGLGYQFGGDFGDFICHDPAAGPATVHITATVLTVDGTFALIGMTPVQPASSPPPAA